MMPRYLWIFVCWSANKKVNFAIITFINKHRRLKVYLPRATFDLQRLNVVCNTDYGHTKLKSLIQIPIPNKYLGFGYEGLVVFCRNMV